MRIFNLNACKWTCDIGFQPFPIQTVSGFSTGSGWINFCIDSKIMITQSARRKTALINAPRTSALPHPKVFNSFKTRLSDDRFETEILLSQSVLQQSRFGFYLVLQ